jgi:hypothetical protein
MYSTAPPAEATASLPHCKNEVDAVENEEADSGSAVDEKVADPASTLPSTPASPVSPPQSRASILKQLYYNPQTLTILQTPVHLTCQICGKAFHSTSSKTKHMKKHGQQQMCPFCGQRFARCDNLARHVRNVHPAL